MQRNFLDLVLLLLFQFLLGVHFFLLAEAVEVDVEQSVSSVEALDSIHVVESDAHLRRPLLQSLNDFFGGALIECQLVKLFIVEAFTQYETVVAQIGILVRTFAKINLTFDDPTFLHFFHKLESLSLQHDSMLALGKVRAQLPLDYLLI